MKIFGNNIAPSCVYCENGDVIFSTEQVICKKKGVMPFDSSCKKFAYDPLKRVPAKRPKLPEYSLEDFSLE